jgi:sugar lactone lactonase YvrE
MNAPESAWVDPATGLLFVSQVGGAPGDRDGNGRISKLTTSGAVVAADWCVGLNAPKGLRGHAGTLWVADLDELAAVELSSGRITKRVKMDGALFLNDVACGADGAVYVSDTMLSRIYRFKDDKVSVFADGPDLEHPNGLLVEGGSLLVAGWGKPEADFSTKVPGRLFRLDLATKAKTLVTKEPTGNLDGVESDGRGGWVLTDWMAGKALHVGPTGIVRVLRVLSKGAADCAYLPATRTLIVPHMLENRTAAYDLSADLP